MSPTVQFNDKSGRRTIKISNIAVYLLLAAKFDWMSAQKLIPQLLFLRGRIFSKLSGPLF